MSESADIYNLSFPPSFFEPEVREGFFVFGMMKRLWAGNLKMLSVVANICRKHEIPWFVICGTLLGTVRHGGFVPWDDDLDIIMKRDDLQRFLEIAPSEIPEGYWLYNVQKDYRTEHSVASLINWREVKGGTLKEFYGCPYTCSVDLFALDGRYEEEAQEKERRKRFYDILLALDHVTRKDTKSEAFRLLLKKIEKENRCSIVRDDLLYGRLCAVLNGLYREVPLAEGKEGEMFHGIDDHLVFHTDCFRDMVWMPFEHIMLPVPVGYQEVLRVNYGDFMRPGRAGSAHEYPSFRKQETVLKEAMGHNLLRYTFRPEHLQVPHDAAGRAKADEMLLVLRAAAQKIEECRRLGDEASALQLEEAAGSLRENLCRMAGTDSLTAPEDPDGMREMIQKRRVLFLPVKASWWNSLAPHYMPEAERNDTQVVVACIPWYEMNADLSRGAKHEESAFFSGEMNVIPAESTDLLSQLWDVIYIQFPYDGTEQTIQTDEAYYAEHLRRITDRLVYVPCYAPAEPAVGDIQGRRALEYLIEQPAVVYADEIRLPSEEMRQLYLDVMTGIAGKGTREFWEKKITVTGDMQKGNDS